MEPKEDDQNRNDKIQLRGARAAKNALVHSTEASDPPGPEALARAIPPGDTSSAEPISTHTPEAASPSTAPACLGYSFRSTLRFYSTSDPSKPPNDDPASASSPTGSSESRGRVPSAAASRRTVELPSAAESRRSPLSTRFSTAMDNLQSRILVATQRLNDLTGYSAIEAIKAQNETLEAGVAGAQAQLRAARAAYKDVNGRRASTQREVATLLARKDGWAPADLERFTALYRRDHELEAGVARAAADLTEAEAEEGRLGAALNAGILRRYHEEQVWSDRIRQQSTWGTWSLMGVNVLLFLVLQFVAEPWRRARLVRGVAEAEGAALDEVRRELGAVRQALAAKEPTGGRGLTPDPPTALVASTSVARNTTLGKPVAGVSLQEVLLDPRRWRPALVDLCSDRTIDLRMRDAALLAFEGAVAGAMLTAGIAALILKRV